MAGNTPARPWTAWLGDELRGDVRTSEDQAKTAHCVWFSRRRQGEDQKEAGAS